MHADNSTGQQTSNGYCVSCLSGFFDAPQHPLTVTIVRLLQQCVLFLESCQFVKGRCAHVQTISCAFR